MFGRSRGPRPAPPRPDAPGLVNDLLFLARTHQGDGNLGAAVVIYDQAAPLVESMAAHRPRDAAHRQMLSDIRSATGMDLIALGRLDEAVERLDQALDAAHAWRVLEPGTAATTRAAALHYESGRLLLRRGHVLEAGGHFEAACELYEQLPADVPERPAWLTDAYAYAAHAFARQGLRTLSTACLQTAFIHLLSLGGHGLTGERPAWGWNPGDRTAELLAQNADQLCAFGHLDLARNSADEAIRAFQRARVFVGDGPWFFATAAMTAGRLHTMNGRGEQGDEAMSLGRSVLVDEPAIPRALVALDRTPPADSLVLDAVAAALEGGLVPHPARQVLERETVPPRDDPSVVTPLHRVRPGSDPAAGLAATVRVGLALVDAARVHEPLRPALCGQLATEAHCILVAASGRADLSAGGTTSAVHESWATCLLGASRSLLATGDPDQAVWALDLAMLAVRVLGQVTTSRSAELARLNKEAAGQLERARVAVKARG